MKSVIFFTVLLSFISKLESQDFLLIPYQENNRWGFIDASMNTIIKSKYDSVSIFQDNRSIVKFNDKYGVINQEGEFIIKPKFKNVLRNYGSIGILAINKKGKYVYFDNKGKRIKQINLGYNCGKGIPNYLNPKKYSIKKGKTIALLFDKVTPDKDYNPRYVRDTTDYIYTSIETYGEDSFIVRDSVGAGIWIPDELYVKIRIKYDEIEVSTGLFQNTYLHKYVINGKVGLIDINGKIVCEAKYYSIYFDNAERNIDPLIKVEYEPTKFGYVDFKGVEYF